MGSSLKLLLAALAGAALAAVAFLRVPDLTAGLWKREPEVEIAATLRAVQREQTLTVLAARFVTVVNARQERFGGLATATKTTIVPGTVRYTLDLAALRPDDLRWDAAAKVLTVRAPAIRLQGPEVDLRGMRAFSDDRVLFALTDAEGDLDSATQAKVGEGLLREARAPLMLKLANDAAKDALRRTFELPLRALDPAIRVEISGR